MRLQLITVCLIFEIIVCIWMCMCNRHGYYSLSLFSLNCVQKSDHLQNTISGQFMSKVYPVSTIFI